MLEANPPPSIADVAYTTTRRRSHHAHRLAVIRASPRALAASLRAWLAGAPAPEVHACVARPGAPSGDAAPGSVEAVAAAFVAGAAVDWARHAPQGGRLVRLPGHA